jgi:hypothetical protein
VFCLSEIGPQLPNFTGYVVVAQWDGRTVPDVQWALDVTRQDTEFRARQEHKFVQLIPTTKGDASHFTYTAYDVATRTYITSVTRNESSASLWAMTITKDVENVTTIGQEVRYAFPQFGATLIGLELYNNKGALTPLAIFKDGTVLEVDQATGASKLFARLVNASSQFLTTAIEYEPTLQKLWAIGQQTNGLPNRFMVNLDLNTRAVTSVLLEPLKNHDPVLCAPFDMVYLPTLQVVLTFNTGDFDQLIFTDPLTGEKAFGTNNMAEFSDGNGHYEFLADDFLEADDMWANSCVDSLKGLVYFQCSSVDDSGEGITSLCATPILNDIKEIPWINTHIQPMTYGYAGMEYVQVVTA